MEDTALVKMFRKLSQGSKQAVQNGKSLDNFDRYMHVDRSIEKAVRRAMDHIRLQGGGLLLLVGSAGDGKSHIIATLKQDYPDFLFHNDASESLSSKLSALDTLKIHLKDMDDEHLATTTKKVVVNINMGKLSEFIDDSEVKSRFTSIIKYASTLFDDATLHHKQDERIRIVSFGSHQIFELYPENKEEPYPVDSRFIRTVLNRITTKSNDNVFYKAYQASQPVNGKYDPVLINYQILSIPVVQNSIVKIIIEAIVRFKLTITPRELFDFIYRLIVPDHLNNFQLNEDFFNTLLPTILYGSGGENRILKSLALLDPLKYGCIDHNDKLSDLFTSNKIPTWECFKDLENQISQSFFYNLDAFYHNNRSNVEDISKLLLRLEHLFCYHSESIEYQNFLSILCRYYENDIDRLYPLYEMIRLCIPHYHGSYTNHSNIVPLNLQGRKYKIFVSCEKLKEDFEKLDVPFSSENRDEFVIELETHWKMNTPVPPLKLDFQLYEYICDISNGRLTLSSERDHNLAFSQFITNLIDQTDYQEKLLIITSDNKQLTLCKTFGKKLILK